MLSRKRYQQIQDYEDENRITVGKFRKGLENLPEDMEITFENHGSSGYFIFSTWKRRGENLIQLELDDINDILSE